MRIIVGVSGGIAAYKACEVIRRFKELGHSVRVIPTPSALKFVGAATFEALSGEPVTTTVWERVDEVAHVALGQGADLVVVAPATANTISRFAQGSADDLLTSTLLVTRAPILLAPAMHTEMWENPSVQENIETLMSRGIHILQPAIGRLTGSDSGVGRLPEPIQIVERALSLVRTQDLAGRKVLVTAGGTREPLDPVRYLGNRSSGRQGIAFARAAASRGGEVTLLAANIEESLLVSLDSKVRVIRVGTALELATAVARESLQTDVVVMAAAVADFRPKHVSETKIKKDKRGELSLDLEKNPDILANLCENRSSLRPGVVLVGFAAETGAESTPKELALEKLRRKPVDFLVVNDVSGGQVFGEESNQGTLFIGSDGTKSIELERMTKDTLAHVVLDNLKERLT